MFKLPVPNQKKKFEGARESCLGQGGRLAVPEDSIEDGTVKALVKSTARIGINYNNVCCSYILLIWKKNWLFDFQAKKGLGEIRWNSCLLYELGTRFDAIVISLLISFVFSFELDQPNLQKTNQNCVDLATTGKWSNSRCDSLTDFVCEFNASKVVTLKKTFFTWFPVLLEPVEIGRKGCRYNSDCKNDSWCNHDGICAQICKWSLPATVIKFIENRWSRVSCSSLKKFAAIDIWQLFWFWWLHFSRWSKRGLSLFVERWKHPTS